jgi:lipoprotein NlpI
MALSRAGKTKEAIAEFQEGVALTPKNPDMRLALGLALLKDGNKNAALTEFKKVVEFAPQSDAAKTARDYIISPRCGEKAEDQVDLRKRNGHIRILFSECTRGPGS